MSFSLSQIQCKKHNKQDDIKACYGVIKGMNILTENVQFGLWKYADYRFSKRCRGRLTSKTLKTMIIDLLEKVCNKSIESISYEDITIYESELLYQIKRAIIYGATRSIYYDESDLINLDQILVANVDKPKNDIDKQELIAYFESLMV